MKATINDNEHGFEIWLEPETKFELLQLLRYASNAKMEKPTIDFSYEYKREPYLRLYLRKVIKQTYSIFKY